MLARPAPTGVARARAWIVLQGYLVWAAAILVGGVLPVSQILGLDQSNAWSLTASIVHFAEFAIMGVLVAVAWRSRVPGRGGLVPSFVISLAYGLFIEIVQWPIPYRDFDLRDWAFDAAGVLAGLLALSIMRRLVGRHGYTPPVRRGIPR